MSVSTESAYDTGLDESAQALDALLHRAGVAAIHDVGWIRVTGEDRVRWLNGMLTNAVQALKPGEGCYNFALNAQGRIQADANVFALDDLPGDGALLIESNRAGELVTLLDHFIIMDDVELSLLASDAREGLLVAGPAAREALHAAGLSVLPAEELRLATVDWNGDAVDVVAAHAPLVPRFELWAKPAVCAALRQRLQVAGVTAEAVEGLRMLEGTPLYGVDIREKELPQETAQTRALHFSKGCYLGQEIVERIRSRGNVHRTFAGFALEGELPAAGVALYAESDGGGSGVAARGGADQRCRLQLQDGWLQPALGYLRREVLERGEPIVYRAQTGAIAGRATPVPLPHRMI